MLRINGNLLTPETAQISVFDRGFQYGDGIFETIAVVNGQLLFWPRHFQRFKAAAELLRLNLPEETEWLADAQSVLDGSPRQVLKLIFSRGQGERGFAISGRERGSRIVYTNDWPNHPARYRREGVAVSVCKTPLLGGGAFSGLKTLNRLNQIVARQELGTEIQEGLMLDSRACLREGTFTNIFWVVNGRVETPCLRETGIPGVMRAVLMEKLRNDGIAVHEVDMLGSRLSDSEECFLSNSIIGVWPVRFCDGVQWPEAPGPITQKLLNYVESICLAESAP